MHGVIAGLIACANRRAMADTFSAGAASAPSRQRLFATDIAVACPGERAHGCKCVGGWPGTRSALRAECAKLGGVGPILPTSAPLAILPTHDRLYTIIGPLNAA